MKRVWILLAVAMIAANSVGCCCRRLCPWSDRGAACCPFSSSSSAPLVAAPAPVCCPPAAPQFATPMAAPMAAPMVAPVVSPMVAPVAQTACPPPCTYWDPCRNAVVAQPVAGFAQQQPMMMAPAAMSFAEPNCGFAMEPACGEPFMGEVSYGPSFTSDCANCASGGIVSEGTFSAPAPESFSQPQNTDPRPAPEQ